MTDLVPPLKVHICWFAGAQPAPITLDIARDLLGFLQQPPDDDVVIRPGLEIPTEFGRDLGKLVAALAAGTEAPARVRVIIVLLDAAGYAAGAAPFAAAMERWAARPPEDTREVYLPILVHRQWEGNLQCGDKLLSWLDATGILTDPTRASRIETSVSLSIVRALRRDAGENDPPKPRLFISYARNDSEELATALAGHFTRAGFEPWLDTSTVNRGEELGAQLVAGTSNGVVLVIRSDRYSESPWCALELLSAKRARAPLVTLLQLDGERLASAYGGNHRTVRWIDKREWELTARCAQALLQSHYFRAHADYLLPRANLSDVTEVLTRRPELLDLVTLGDSRRLLLHPDPPLSEPEAEVLRLARPEVRLATPRTLLGRVLLDKDPKPPLTGMVIAFSLSRSSNLFDVSDGHIGDGLTQQMLLSALESITLATLNSGARIAFGGDFRDKGYTQKLADLHRLRRRVGRGAGAQLICYLDHGTREGGQNPEYAPVEVTLPDAADQAPAEARTWFWLEQMREVMARDSHARIVLGGKTEPRDADPVNGYNGPWSGILEEALRMLEHGKALYVLGGFHGIAGVIAEMLVDGAVPPVLQDATYAAAPMAARFDALAKARDALGAIDLPPVMSNEQLAKGILDKWQKFVGGDETAWANGLTVDQNLALLRSTDQTEITLTIFEALSAIARRGEKAGSLALYFGDICTVPNIDGYAVSVSPGVPPIGASAALDKKLGGRLSAEVTRSDGHITLIEGAGKQLAGRVVFVGELRVPDNGPVTAEMVKTLTQGIVTEADRKGIQSLAVHLFGATLGLGVEECARAIQDGFVAAGSAVVHTLAICELDPDRYELLHAEFPDAIELRSPIAPPAVVDPGAVLHVDAKLGDTTVGVESTLYSTSNHQPVVPFSPVQIPRAMWNALRRRFQSYQDSVAIGTELWTSLINGDLDVQLKKQRGRLVVLTDADASGLPWELLNNGTDDPVAYTTKVVRQIKLLGACRTPEAPTRASAKLKALVIIDPTNNLPGAAKEGADVAAALSARPDFAVTPLIADQATPAAVTALLGSGTFELLHYSGHAFFDEARPQTSGLLLSGGVLTGDMLGQAKPPRLVFLSACESGRVREQQQQQAAPERPSFSLAETFLRNGVAALVGTFFTVADTSAARFAARVYTELGKRTPLGDAVHAARAELFEDRIADWGNFMLFGDDAMVL